MADSDDKYIVFNRDEYERHPDHPTEIHDAVVIRRQDKFASPALATYAAMIAIAMSMAVDEETKRQLSRISDYFEDQAKLAADEGWKLPDV